jgi:hypothetical protein
VVTAVPRASLTTMSSSARKRSKENRTGPSRAARRPAKSFAVTSSRPRKMPDSGVDPMIVRVMSSAMCSCSGRGFPRDVSV